MARAFIVRPFGKKKDSAGSEIDFDLVGASLIEPAIGDAGLAGGTTGQIVEAGNIREDMFKLILAADVVICDITIHNANVFYELGIRHALRKKSTILIKGTPTKDSTPFDVMTDRYLPYEISDPGQTRDDLVNAIKASLASERESDSPVFQMLPSLPQGDPSKVVSVPVAFAEEVDRARAAGSKGWLRLLSDEVKELRFSWEGLKLVGAAQWSVRDWEGALRTWQAVEKVHPNDVDANLALANIWERTYRASEKSENLAHSDHAISRVLAVGDLPLSQRAEALALRGRNVKTRWRAAFESKPELEDRRNAAMGPQAIEAYEAYKEAYSIDLNKYYPGINALQMATLLEDLARDPNWYDAFHSDARAESYLEDLKSDLRGLGFSVPLAVRSAQAKADGADKLWADISAADVTFLTSPASRKNRVINAYLNAVPADDPFAWDAASGQLKLFASLGVKPDLATAVITALDASFRRGAGTREDEKSAKPKHLVVLAGHLIDRDNQTPRFPSAAEDKAKRMLAEALQELDRSEWELTALASAGPGTDILAHEVCDELGVPSTICLPMPVRDYAREIFAGLEDWRNRLLDLTDRHTVLELSHRAGLPRWLEGSSVDPWERGNRWASELAATWGAGRVTLVALWDGKRKGTPGGTAQMVELATKEEFRIKVLDAKQLLDDS